MLRQWLKNVFEPTPNPAPGGNISNSGPDCGAESAGATGSGTGSRPCSNPSQPPNSVPEPVQAPKEPVQAKNDVLRPRPHPMAQATAFLAWLRAKPKYAGKRVFARHVKKDLYPLFLAEKNWRSRPWDGRLGVGKFLKQLTG